MIARGLSNRDIAKQVNISYSSVKKDIADIFVQLGVVTRAEAIASALRLRLIREGLFHL